MSSKPYTLKDFEKSYIHGQIAMFGAVHAYFEVRQGAFTKECRDRLIDLGLLAETQGSIERNSPEHASDFTTRVFQLTPAGIERFYTPGLLSEEEIAAAKLVDARWGKAIENSHQGEAGAANGGIAVSDDFQATLKIVLDAAKAQERVHPRDASFIMDNLSVRQCREFVLFAEGKQVTGDVEWARGLGLILSGVLTLKGQAFYQSIV